MPNIHCKYDELVPVADLKPYKKNRNQHTPEQIERLARLLLYQGIRAPVVVANAPYSCIVKGHGTVEAIKKNGWPEAPVVYQDFEDDDQLYAFVQSDNAIASWADLDLSSISTDIGDLGPDFDTDLLGIKDLNVDPEQSDEPVPDADLVSIYEVVVVCKSEDTQREAYEKISGLGYECRVLSM